MKNIVSKIVLILFIFLNYENTSFGQIISHYAFYDHLNDKVRICIEDKFCYADSKHLRLKTINHFKVKGDSIEIQKQLWGMKKFCDEHKEVRIRIIEIHDSDEIVYLDPLLQEFKHLSVLIINNSNNIKLENIIKYINAINDQPHIKNIKKFKKKFKARPSIYYLNSLVFKNQLLEELDAPSDQLRTFNYLEEIRIETPKKGSKSQAFVNSLVTNWIMRDTVHYLNSTFPNLRFLGFKNCGLDSIPFKLKYKQELISLDLSGNNLKEIPECLTQFNSPRTLLSLNLSSNQISELDEAFLYRFCGTAETSSKFSKYLFLSDNGLSYQELLKLKNQDFKGKFNTITFECNPIELDSIDRVGAILDLAREIDKERIAKFMTGAQRSETDYNPAVRLFEKCEEIGK